MNGTCDAKITVPLFNPETGLLLDLLIIGQCGRPARHPYTTTEGVEKELCDFHAAFLLTATQEEERRVS